MILYSENKLKEDKKKKSTWEVTKVYEEEYVIEFGVADVKREGSDITLVATSSMVYVAMDAAEQLSDFGISAEVVDPRTTLPLDAETLIASAKKTSRVIVLDEGYEQYGVTAEIASVIADGAFYYLDANSWITSSTKIMGNN